MSILLNAEEMKRKYGLFLEKGANLRLDKRKVPRKFWPLLPYAEFWMREHLVEQAPPDVLQNLKEVIASIDNALDEWLAGPEADVPNPSDEYVAFSAMRLAGYSA